MFHVASFFNVACLFVHLSVHSHANKHASFLEESIPTNQPEKVLEKDKLQLQDDLEKKLPDEMAMLKESEANPIAGDDD